MPNHLTRNSQARPRSRTNDDSFFPVWVIYFLALDFVLYFLIPIAAIFIQGTFLYLTNINIGAIGEILLIVFVTFFISSTVFKGRLESYFCPHILGGDHQFTRILLIRDVVNTASIAYFGYKLLRTIQIISGHELLSRNLHEGVLFVALDPFFDRNTLESLNIKLSYSQDCRNYNDLWKEWNDQSAWFKFVNGEESVWKKFLNLIKLKMMARLGAELITYFAQLTTAITKLIYFTSLFNYQRAMNIFIQMKQNGQFPIEQLKKNETETDEGEVEDLPDAGNQVEVVEVYQNPSARSAGSPEGGPV